MWVVSFLGLKKSKLVVAEHYQLGGELWGAMSQNWVNKTVVVPYITCQATHDKNIQSLH